jgi:methionyl-tRNA synthetase
MSTSHGKPVLPGVAAAAEEFLNAGALTWDSRETALLGNEIRKFRPLLTRLEQQTVDAMVEKTKASAAAPTDNETDGQPEPAVIDIDTFLHVDLRVAEVVAAEAVEGADKLIRVTVDLGGERRQVLAGIRSAYDPVDLVGRQVILVANLAPRKMRFGTSEGMLLAAGPGGQDIFLIGPDSGARPGMRVR